jgi:CTP synthase
LEQSTIEKIAMFCQVESEQVLAVHNVQTTYHVPLLLEKQGLLNTLGNILNLDAVPKSQQLVERGQRIWAEWRNLTSQQERLFESVTIALVGKYTNLHDSYLSTVKALEHSAMRCGKKLDLIWIDAGDLEEPAKELKPAKFHKAWHSICTADGILVPGGFGSRGIEGMIAAAKYARENKRPYLGICLGMQIAVIEFARNICNLPLATSQEINNNAEDKVIIFMPEIDNTKLGGTMRLGLRPTIFQEGSEWSRLRKMYGEKKQINERHRHRYEVNPAYIERLSEKGFEFIGKDDKGERMEIIELKDHPWFVGVQFHPEYLSRVLQPSKPYLGFVAAAAGCLEKVTADCLHEYGVNGINGEANGLNGVRI